MSQESSVDQVDEEASVILYFGKKWDAPFLDEEPGRRVIQNPTPAGAKCFHCEEVIVQGDRGVFHPVMRGKVGEMTGSIEPLHAECDLRRNLGGVPHWNGECSCKGHENVAYSGTRREEALELFSLLNAERQKQGRGPLWEEQ